MPDQRAACESESRAAEEERVRAAFMGEAEAGFAEMAGMYGPMVTRLARRLLGWREAEAEDAVQEVFVRAYVGRRSFRGASSLETWLTRITVNVCRSMWRRKIIRLEFLRQWTKGREQEDAIAVEEGKDEESERVREAVRRLSAKEREVIVLYYLEEIGAVAIAKMLGVSEGAVNVRLHRGRKRLEESLGSLMEDRHE